DGLHRDAGSENVDELHGSLNEFYCMKCKKTYHKTDVMNNDNSYCECCWAGRPVIVLYGDTFNEFTVVNSMSKLQKADTLIVLGTSLAVNPAAYLTTYFSGENFVIINKDETPFDSDANLVINDDMTDVINAII